MRDDLMTTAQLIAAIGIGRATLWRWQQRPERPFPPAVRHEIGSKKYYKVDQAEAWLSQEFGRRISLRRLGGCK